MSTENPWITAAERGHEVAAPGSSERDPGNADGTQTNGTAQSSFDGLLNTRSEESPADGEVDETAAPPRAPLFGFKRAPRASEAPVDVAVTGPVAPQEGVRPLERMLATAAAPSAAVHVVGAHGGAGASSIASLSDDWVDAGTSWPAVANRDATCVLVARTHSGGLLALRDALTQWAAGEVKGVALLGVILIRDAPGKMPPPLRDLEKVVTGGAPRVWRVAFQDSWRMGDPPRERRDRAVKRMAKQIADLASEPDAPNKEEI